jgi:hypothetical protein
VGHVLHLGHLLGRVRALAGAVIIVDCLTHRSEVAASYRLGELVTDFRAVFLG